SIGDDNDMRIVERFFLLQEITTELRSNFEDRQKIRGNADRGDAERNAQTGNREVGAVESRDVVETMVALLPVLKVWIRCRHLGEFLPGRRFANIKEALRIAEWKRTQDRAIENRKNRRCCADPDGHCQDRHQRKARLAMNHAKSILKVAAKVGPDAQPP